MDWCKLLSLVKNSSVTTVFVLYWETIFLRTGIALHASSRRPDVEDNQKATVFGYYVNNPERYGVAEFDRKGNVLSIEENQQSKIQLYFYSNKMVVTKNIKPSVIGNLEINAVNQEFLKDIELKVQMFGCGYARLDTGTHDSLSETSTFIEVTEKYKV